jgi:hypothetical protein
MFLLRIVVDKLKEGTYSGAMLPSIQKCMDFLSELVPKIENPEVCTDLNGRLGKDNT